MTQPLATSNEAARHSLRRRLPPPRVELPQRDDDQDLKLFVLSFTAFFICFYTFLA